MDKIRFKTLLFDLKDAVNVSPSRLQASVIKGDSTVDEIANEADGANEIYILDEKGETKAIYTGYNKRLAVYWLDDYVSVELENADILSRLDLVEAKADTNAQGIAQVNATLESDVTSINGEIANLNETQMSQDAAIEDLASAL